MSGIDITHPHSLPPEQARSAVEDVAGKLAQRFDMQTAWEGDTLRFKRSGVDGAIDMLPGSLRLVSLALAAATVAAALAVPAVLAAPAVVATVA